MEIPEIYLIEGVDVSVLRPVKGATDDMGEPVDAEPAKEPVSDVLFDPTASSDIAEGMRLNNIEVDAEFHFPKTYEGDLRGCSIAYGGRTYAVVGDIRRFTEANVPGKWNGVATCKEVS